MNGAVRLVNGRRASEGSVQICVNGVWGHVCGSSWSTSNTRVVCRQLGYSTTGIQTLFSVPKSITKHNSCNTLNSTNNFIYFSILSKGARSTLRSVHQAIVR